MSDDQTGDQTEAELERTRKVVAETVAKQVAANEDAVASADTDAAPSDADAVERPKGNAGRDEWAAYANARGYDIDDQWGRDDIRDLFAEES